MIVVPHSASDDYTAYEHRLRSELTSEGFQPVSVEIQTEVSAPLLRQHAKRLMSPAAISLAIRDHAISGWVWIQSKGNGNDLLRAVPEYPLSSQAPQIFAVKAADVLHGGLLELGYLGTSLEPPPPPRTAPSSPASASSAKAAAPEQPGQASTSAPKALPDATNGSANAAAPTPAPHAKLTPTPSPAPHAKLTPTQYAWHLRGLLSLVQTTSGSPLELSAALSATYHVHAHWALGLTATYLGRSSFRTEPFRGGADVTQATLGPRLELRQPLSKRLCVFEAVEAGAHGVFVAGEATTGLLAHHAWLLTPYASPALGLDLKLSGRLSTTLQTAFLYPLRRADVMVAKTRVSEAGTPAILFSAGLEVNL